MVEQLGSKNIGLFQLFLQTLSIKEKSQEQKNVKQERKKKEVIQR